MISKEYQKEDSRASSRNNNVCKFHLKALSLELRTINGVFMERIMPEPKDEVEIFLQEININSSQIGDELLLAKKAMAIEKIYPSQDFDKIFMSKMETYSEADRRNLWLQTHYAIRSRHQQRLDDLMQIAETGSPIEKQLSDLVSNELRDRERLYKENYLDNEL